MAELQEFENTSSTNQMYTPNFTEVNSSGAADDTFYQRHVDITMEIRHYAMPCIAAVGIVFNILSAVVFSEERMRQISSSRYFLALSVSDSLSLLGELIKWLGDDRLGYSFLYTQRITCKFVYHLRYSSQLLAAFLVATVTSERLFVVYYPLKASAVLTVNLAIGIITGEAVAAILLGAYGSILFDQVRYFGKPFCLIDFLKDGVAYEYCNLIISKILGEVLTSVAVAVMTGIIIYKLMRSRKQRSELSGGNSKMSGSSTAAQDRQLTVMLVVVASTFVVLRAPYTIIWYLSHYRNTQPFFPVLPENLRRLSEGLNISYVLYMMNYAINFFLYSLSGRRFRETLAGLCCGRRHGNQGMSSAVTMSTLASETSGTMQREQPDIVRTTDVNSAQLKK